MNEQLITIFLTLTAVSFTSLITYYLKECADIRQSFREGISPPLLERDTLECHQFIASHDYQKNVADPEISKCLSKEKIIIWVPFLIFSSVLVLCLIYRYLYL